MTARARPVVTVYTRQRCGLCRRAEDAVARLARGRADIVLVDVDDDPALVERYGVRVPVIVVDGEEVSELEVDHRRLRAALGRRGRRGRRYRGIAARLGRRP